MHDTHQAGWPGEGGLLSISSYAPPERGFHFGLSGDAANGFQVFSAARAQVTEPPISTSVKFIFLGESRYTTSTLE